TVTVFRSLRRAAAKLGRHTPALTERAAGRAVMMAVFCARPWRYPAEAAAIDSEAIVSNTVLDRADRRAFLFSAPVDEDLPLTIRGGLCAVVLLVRQVALATGLSTQAKIATSADVHVPMSDVPEGVAASSIAGAERRLAYTPARARV